jgi:DUF1680 family protein
MPTWVYSKSPDGVYVNLFVGSTIRLENVAGTEVEMVQTTNYPWSGKLAITVNPKESKTFAVRVRVPNRSVSSLYTASPDADGMTSLAVNGKPVKIEVKDGYAVINRAWKAGDKIEAELPMKPQKIKASDKIEATRGKVALRYGPLIYNIEQMDQDITKPISKDAPLTTEWRSDLLGGVMVIKGEFADGSPLLAIPNYARTNRVSALPVEDPGTAPGGGRPAPPPPVSIVWIRES